MHRIDLSKYDFRTDMIVDEKENITSNINEKAYNIEDVKVSWLKLEDGNNLNKKPGNYLTLEFSDITDTDYKLKVRKIFKDEFSKFLNLYDFSLNKKTLVVGLGNIKSTPDALGPLTIEKIITTKHLFEIGNVDDNLSCVSAFYPGVTGQTGIETYDYVSGIIKEVKPDLLIIIDALASSSISRVNRSVQVSDTGIAPGSGIGNYRKELTRENLGIPVIVIGIPTVTSASVIVTDTINYMLKNYVYNKQLTTKKVSKFIAGQVNYINKDINVSESDKKTLLGLVGLLNENELKELVYEVLTPIGYNLMVAPKEVDFVIEKLSEVLSFGINNSLHNI